MVRFQGALLKQVKVTAAKELLQWVLGVVFKDQVTIDDMEYLPRTVYTYPQQDDAVEYMLDCTWS